MRLPIERERANGLRYWREPYNDYFSRALWRSVQSTHCWAELIAVH
jgi:hypothetical protein